MLAPDTVPATRRPPTVPQARTAGKTLPALAPPEPVLPPPRPASLHPRHRGVLAGFLLMVLLPVALSAWYLRTRAADRYLSTAAFSVRSEESGPAVDLLGGMARLTGAASPDPDILYGYIRSPELVAEAEAALGLRALWSRADPARDPVFAYHPPGTIEDLTAYWRRRVRVQADSATGLIELRVEAFAPEDARNIAAFILDRSAAVVNRLSAAARADATRYTAEDLAGAVGRLKDARAALTAFRNRSQMVDPQAAIAGQMGLLASLQAQLAQALVELDLLRQNTRPGDARITQAERRIAAIEARIAGERRRLGDTAGDAAGDTAGGEAAFAGQIGEYERLAVDLQFAEQSYTAALAAHQAAQAEARRQSRYLAAHVRPTLPEAPEHPRRLELVALVALFGTLLWGLATLTAYAIRDRR